MMLLGRVLLTGYRAILTDQRVLFDLAASDFLAANTIFSKISVVVASIFAQLAIEVAQRTLADFPLSSPC